MVRREMEEVVEEEFHCVEEKMKKKAVGVLQNVVYRLVQNFQQHQQGPDQSVAMASISRASSPSTASSISHASSPPAPPSSSRGVPSTGAMNRPAMETLQSASERYPEAEGVGVIGEDLDLATLISEEAFSEFNSDGKGQGYDDLWYLYP